MGKASRWFRNILGFKKVEQKPTSNPDPDSDQKHRRTSVKSTRENANAELVTKQRELRGSRQHHEVKSEPEEEDDGKHAIAVAVATAAVADAAVAAAKAAAAVVRLTNSNSRCARNLPAHFSSSRSNNISGCEIQIWAAIWIQSTFRGYLARRALRALKGLVKLQAIIRGHIERKRTAEWLRRMQALLRVQTRARAGRSLVSESSQLTNKSYHSHHHGPPTPEKIEHAIRSKSMKYEQSPILKKNGSVSNGRIVYDFDQSHASWTPSDGELSANQKASSVRTYTFGDENNDNKRSPVTPTMSDGSRSYVSGYSDHPSYMSYTESSKAKLRSYSAPKQRPQYERTGSGRRCLVNGFSEPKSQKVLTMNVGYSKAYSGSGRLDRLGMPIGARY